MASQAFNIAKKYLSNAEINPQADTIKVALLMTNQTVDNGTSKDCDNIDAFSTLDEFDGTNYTRQTLTINPAVDDAADRAEAIESSGTTKFSGIMAGTRAIDGALVYLHVSSSDTLNIPIGWVEFTADITANGGDVTITWSSNGVWTLS